MGEQPDIHSLVDRAVAGDRPALEKVVLAIKDELYGLSLRMLANRYEAEDAAQEILIQVITHLAQWRRDSSFRTWTWKIATRHLMRMKPGKIEEIVSFELGEKMISAGAGNPPLPPLTEAELDLLETEVRISCTQGMLTSLERDQRIAFILGELFELPSETAADVLDIDAATYRERLSRARETLGTWMGNLCGLVDPEKPCRCRRQIPIALEWGFISQEHPQWVSHPERPAPRQRLPVLDDTEQAQLGAYPVFDHRDYAAPRALVARIRALLDAGTLKSFS